MLRPYTTLLNGTLHLKSISMYFIAWAKPFVVLLRSNGRRGNRIQSGIRETIGESKMKVRGQIWMWTLGLALALGLAAVPSRVAAQDKDHVVSLDELKSDAAKPAQTRDANEAEVRHLLQTEAGQQALKQAKVDYAKVDKAISQLSDDDLATVAEKSRQADHDFAAGGLSQTLIIVIVLIVILIVVLAIVF